MSENGAIHWTNERRKLRNLVPWEHNPREINKREAERLGESLLEFGQIQTIAIGPDNEVYDGHQRKLVWSVLPQFGPDYEVDVRVSSRPLTERERQKLVVFLHRGAVGQWDWDELANSFELDDLLEWGFDEAELIGDWGDEPTPDPGAQVDKAQELQEKWGVAEGDIWQCGEHFVICGDCRESETWAHLIERAGVDKVNGVFTSPPYAEQRKGQYGGVPVDEYVDWWEAVQENVRANLADDGSFFVNIKPHCEDGERVLYVFDLVLAMKRRWGWRFADELCWYRGGPPGKWDGRLKNEFEPVYQFSVGQAQIRHANIIQDFSSATRPEDLTVYDGVDNAPSRGNSPFKQKWKKSAEFDGALPGNVLRIWHSSTATHTGAYHSAPFPPGLPDFFVRAYSDAADVWLDPFLGSGTTIVAAHQNERRGLGIERLPKYVSVTLERLAGMGLEPQRVETATFANEST
jgi:DNA modification methylase